MARPDGALSAPEADANPTARGTLQPLPRGFFGRDAETVARDMLGVTLIHRIRGRDVRARIVETEAYVGESDLACHASRGRTARTSIMFGPPGYAYVYLIYGMHHMFNVVTGEDGQAQAVLIRAAEPLDTEIGALNGPGRLTKALGITRDHDGVDVCRPPLWFASGHPPNSVVTTTRIGVDYAGEWADAPLRFYDADSQCVSNR